MVGESENGTLDSNSGSACSVAPIMRVTGLVAQGGVFVCVFIPHIFQAAALDHG